jgi:conjugative relaxase-like TrwC/TraI family protein
VGVASVSAMKSADYYTNLQSQDYYLKGAEPKGLWWGDGATKLGLSEQIEQKTFSNLFYGMSDDGQKLVENANKINRRAGWDVTFSSDKSFSALWAIADDETRTRLEHIHDAAVKDAIAYFQANMPLIRVQDQGVHWRENGELVVGLFQHGSTRAEDPELHTHACFLNVAVTPSDNQTRTIDSHEIYKHKMMMGAVYRASMSSQCMEAGFQVERTEKGLMQVVGVPEHVKAHWSKRSGAIEQHLADYGLDDTPENRARAALATRTAKRDTNRDDLLMQWQQEGHTMGFTAANVTQLQKPSRSLTEKQRAKALQEITQEAESKVLESQTHFAKREFVTEFCNASIGRGLSMQDITSHTEQYFEQQRIINLGEHKRTIRYTTHEQLKSEKEFIDKVHVLHNRSHHQINESSWNRFSKSLDKSLSEEQLSAIRHLTTGGDLVCMTGMAGTGKSSVLRPAREIWEKQGYNVIGISLSGKATDGLATGAGFSNTMTIDSLFAKIDYAQKHGSIANDFLRFNHPLQRDCVVVVDEAGMADNAKLQRLVDEATKQKTKLVLVGDSKQLQAISNGGAFAVACEQVGHSQLTQIFRQKQEWSRNAVHDFAEGNAEKALRAYDQRSLLHVKSNKKDLHNKLISDWAQAGGAMKPAQHLILCSTNDEVFLLNQQAQATRREAGALAKKQFWLNGNQFYVGDRVVCLKNDKTADVKNGNFGEVTHYSSLSHILKLKAEDGKTRTINVKEYADIALGYAVTTHKAQGVTVNHSYVLTGGAMQDRELTYVQMSRHRDTNQLYTIAENKNDAIDKLSIQMNQSREKQFATTLLEATQQKGQERTMNL